jgi:DNA-binding NtrC family response regulator
MTRPIHVLHVDDNAALRDLTAEFLERVTTDLSVHSVADPTVVPATIADEPIDCVVSDYEMPDRNGIELCREVRETHPDLPFFLFTSRGGADLVRAAIEAGATDYVRKEPGVEQYTLLANRIANAVSKSRLDERIRKLERAVDERVIGPDDDLDVELVGEPDSEAVESVEY